MDKKRLVPVFLLFGWLCLLGYVFFFFKTGPVSIIEYRGTQRSVQHLDKYGNPVVKPRDSVRIIEIRGSDKTVRDIPIK